MKPEKSSGSAAQAAAPGLDHGLREVLTLAEVAEYLRVPEDDVLRMVREQGLPGRRIGPEWRFLKAAVQDWLRTATSKSGKEAILAIAGAFKDDPYLESMVQEIYERRGRPMIEDAR